MTILAWFGSRRLLRAAALLLALPMVMGVPTTAADAQSPPSVLDASALRAATALYDATDWAEAIRLLSAALASSPPDHPLARDARLLLARCQVKIGQPDLAKQEIHRILSRDRSWRPDERELPGEELAVILEAVREYRPKTGRRWPWYAAGAGALAVGVWLFWPDDESAPEPLPGPPGPPAGAARPRF